MFTREDNGVSDAALDQTFARALEDAERQLAGHVAVAEALAAWDSVERGGERLLAGLAEPLGCQAGVLWVPRGDRLKPRVFWRALEENVQEFRMMTLTSRLRRGAELPGQAWLRGEPQSLGSASEDGSPRWRAAIAAGLCGAVAVPAIRADEVLAVVELASREEPQLTQPLARSLSAIGHVLGQFLAHRRGDLGEQLVTDRQLEVLRLAALGLSAREIAERLIVSPATVRTHFENIYPRLGVRDKASAVAEAVRLGLID